MKRLLTFFFALCTITMARAQITTISSEAEWNTFANNVNNGTSYQGQIVQLAADISVSTMVGTEAHPFCGNFLGQNHTLTVNINSTEMAPAPFRYISGAFIGDLTVEGSVTGTTTNGNHAAGLVGSCRPGNTSTIKYCIVNVHVSSEYYAGGIVGHAGNGTKLAIEDCVFGGTITDFTTYAGGLVGWGDTFTLTLEDCLVKGTFTPGNGGLYHPIGCCNNANDVTATTTKCYYLKDLTHTATGSHLLPNSEGTPVTTSLWSSNVKAADGYIYYAPPTTPGRFLPGDMNDDHKFTLADLTMLVDKVKEAGNIVYAGSVDLGLPSGTLWADKNLGASTSTDAGYYFAWGETEPYGANGKTTYDWPTYKWCNGSEYTLTKYCNYSSFGYNGFTDNLTELLPKDDAATMLWGIDWRMPSKAQVDELYTECTWTLTTQNGVDGYRVTGPNGNSIFLPFTVGKEDNEYIAFANDFSCFWSRTIYPNSPYCAYCIMKDRKDVQMDIFRYVGLPIRPVRASQP